MSIKKKDFCNDYWKVTALVLGAALFLMIVGNYLFVRWYEEKFWAGEIIRISYVGYDGLPHRESILPDRYEALFWLIRQGSVVIMLTTMAYVYMFGKYCQKANGECEEGGSGE